MAPSIVTWCQLKSTAVGYFTFSRTLHGAFTDVLHYSYHSCAHLPPRDTLTSGLLTLQMESPRMAVFIQHWHMIGPAAAPLVAFSLNNDMIAGGKLACVCRSVGLRVNWLSLIAQLPTHPGRSTGTRRNATNTKFKTSICRIRCEPQILYYLETNSFYHRKEERFS